MKKQLAICVFVALVLLVGYTLTFAQLGAKAIPLSPGDVEVTHVDSEGAHAFFSSRDATGCVQSDVWMFLSMHAVRLLPDGQQTSGAEVTILVSVFDHCAGVTLLDAVGHTPDFTFSEGTGLKTAYLFTPSVLAVDRVSNQYVELSVTVSWDGSGDLQSGTEQFIYKDFPGVMVVTHLQQRWREAVATGLVSDGTRNLSPEPSLFAQIQDVRNGTIVVHRNRR